MKTLAKTFALCSIMLPTACMPAGDRHVAVAPASLAVTATAQVEAAAVKLPPGTTSLWKAPPLAVEKGMCSKASSLLRVEEIERDGRWIYLMLSHQGIGDRTGQTPTIIVVADGRKQKKPMDVDGVLWSGDQSSWIRFPIASLKSGELDLIVEAHGTRAYTTLLNRANVVDHLPTNERADYESTEYGTRVIPWEQDALVMAKGSAEHFRKLDELEAAR